MTQESVEELAKRLEQDANDGAFEGWKDWHLLRALGCQRLGLVEKYTYLLDNEPCDEE